jgi:hypothetical protein
MGKTGMRTTLKTLYNNEAVRDARKMAADFAKFTLLTGALFSFYPVSMPSSPYPPGNEKSRPTKEAPYPRPSPALLPSRALTEEQSRKQAERHPSVV